MTGKGNKGFIKSISDFRRSAALAALCVLLVVSAAGCGTADSTSGGSAGADAGKAVQGDTTEHSTTVFAMDTVMNITTYGGSDELLNKVQSRIEQLESMFSTTDENSEIYAVNRDGSAKVSSDTETLTKFALGICGKTNGALDISIYPVVREWGFTTGDFKVPDDSVINDLLTHVDYRKVRLDENEDTITLDKDMKIDLGSVAKGYTGDRIIDMLREAGVQSALLDLGGNIQTLGSKTDGSDWRVAVQDPKDPSSGDYLGVVAISDKAVITSGGYERYFQGPDGKTYWHIIDPSTGCPAENGLISVTIIGDKGVYCDSLSTSLFIMGKEKAAEFWKQYQDFDMVLVSDDGEVDITEGIADRFELSNTKDYHLNVISR